MKKTMITTGLACGLALFTGCTSFVTATGNSKVGVTVTTTVLGLNLAAASSENLTPAMQFGVIKQMVQFMPAATNGTIAFPNYAVTGDFENNYSPFSLNGYESMAAGQDSTLESGVATNAVNIEPVVPK